MNLENRSVKEEFDGIDSKESLIQLINNIYNRYARISDPDLKGKKHFTEKQINFYLHNLKLPVEHDDHKLYSTSEIQKKSGGKRIIHAPVSTDFKDLLSCIDFLIRQIYNPHPRAFGFIEEKSIVDNARLHLNKNYVYNIDLKDFFHSFDLNRVKLSLSNKPFHLKDELEPLAYLIASLVTCNLNGRRVLPQGSPVSPVLTNHICWRLDHRLSGLAKRYGLVYSRYADDITFSSNHNVYFGEFIDELKRIIQLEGLDINPKKTRLQKRGSKQEVTGITVNEGLNVSKRYIKQLRMYLYYCERYGIEKAENIYHRDYKEVRKEGELFINPGKLENILKGKLNYLSMVKGKDDPVYIKLSNRYNLIFEKKTTRIDEIILHWVALGIDAARKKYYESAMNKDFHDLCMEMAKENSEFDLELPEIIEDEKILVKEHNLKGLHPYILKIFDFAYSFQFKNEHERNTEYEILTEKLVTESIKQNKTIRHFMDNVPIQDYDTAIKFLKAKLDKDPIFYGNEFLMLRKDKAKDLQEAFINFKKMTNE